MLFSSQLFILLFLPVVLLAYYARASSEKFRTALLTLASFVFYAWWDPRFLPLLAAMIVITWLIVEAHVRFGHRALLIIGVVINLAVLGLFKYANFFAEAVLSMMAVTHDPWSFILPLGISFFTFQQVSYLVDRIRGDAPRYDFLGYAAYVSFFPQLIAGPIVRHNELIKQFELSPRRAEVLEMASRGVILFTLGLVKKVFLADELAPIANDAFDPVAAGATVTFAESWLAALAYSCQLYFDFSAYSDMAMGLGAMFGLRLPVNFDAPYRSVNIRDFWRRWHMSLSSFLRDYLYIPLGGNRGGFAKTCATVMTTMLLCGLWHGAGWTFIVWGGAHGLAICVNRLWARSGIAVPRPFAWLLTIFFVVCGWVLFRAETFTVAATFFQSMFWPANFIGAAFDGDDTLYVVTGLAFALLGPTNLALSQHAGALRRSVSIAVGVALFLVTLRVGQGRGLEFIYFQF